MIIFGNIIDFMRLSYRICAARVSKFGYKREDWTLIKTELEERYRLLKDVYSEYADKSEKDLQISKRIIAIDLLIEKAQYKLTERSRSYYRNGKILFVISYFIVLLFIIYNTFATEIKYYILLKLGMPTNILSPEEITIFPHYNNFPYPAFTLILIKKIVIGGAVLGLAYMLAATANSCFKEATILLHRRHLLRYLRLLSYENDGKITSKDLRDIFGVDDATRTGFDSIKVESIRDNLIGKLIDAISIKNARAEISSIDKNRNQRKISAKPKRDTKENIDEHKN